MAFPTTSTLDTFDRTNSATLGANWSDLLGLGLRWGISSNTAAPQASNAADYWNGATYTNVECYGIISTKPADGAGTVYFLARLASVGGTTFDGYAVALVPASGTDQVAFFRIDNGVPTQLGATISQEVAAGESLGLEVNSTTLTAYYKTGGSWSSLGTRTDSTYSAAGRIGLLSADTSPRINDFGGGTIVAGTTYDGGATLAGAGAITGRVILIANPGGSVAGAGALNAQGQRLAIGNAGLSGVGAINAQGQRAAQGEAGISGVGALNAQGQRTAEGQAGIAGVGQLGANPQRIAEGNASFSGIGALTSQGFILAVGAAVLQGIGRLYGDGEIATAGGTTYTASAFMAGVGALSAEGQRAAQGAISLAGAGTLYADAQRAAEGATALAGAGQMTAFGQRIAEGVAALSAIGLLSGQAQRLAIGGIELPGVGALGITVRVQMMGDATLPGAGRLTAYAVVVAQNRGAGSRRQYRPYDRVDYEQLRRETHAAPDRERNEAG